MVITRCSTGGSSGSNNPNHMTGSHSHMTGPGSHVSLHDSTVESEILQAINNMEENDEILSMIEEAASHAGTMSERSFRA